MHSELLVHKYFSWKILENTSHGKGVVDGLGGTVKRIVWGAVSTRKVSNVQDAVTFAKIAAQFSKSVNVQLCLKKDIDD